MPHIYTAFIRHLSTQKRLAHLIVPSMMFDFILKSAPQQTTTCCLFHVIAAMAPANAVTVKRWLSSVYPTFAIDDTWLDECLSYLTQHRQDLLGPALLKTVEQQILLSPLETCASLGALPASLDSLDRLGGKAVLVQVISLDDVGQSAMSIKEALHARRDEARLGAVNAARVRVHGLTQTDEDLSASASTTAAAAAAPDATKYPRSMLKLELSDGFTGLSAIEYRRIHALALGETDLGCKLLLKNCKVRQGVLLLEPETVVVKGRLQPRPIYTRRMRLMSEWLYCRRINPGAQRGAGGPS